METNLTEIQKKLLALSKPRSKDAIEKAEKRKEKRKKRKGGTTMEQKAERYDEAIERAKEWYNNPNSSSIGKAYLYAVFPELKESEDERMRNIAIYACKYMVDNFENSTKQYEDAIAWLEKQGEQPQGKSVLEVWKDMRLEVYQQASGNRHEPNCSDDTTKMFSLNDIDEIIEKISEQDSANKVEPKFHDKEKGE